MANDRSSLSFTAAGSGDTTLLLLHGFPMNRTVWAGVIRELSDAVRTVAIDLPGFGQSPIRPGWTMDSLADELLTLIAKNGWTRWIVAGLSMGGYVALAMAAKQPAGLAGVILVDSRADADTPSQKQNRDRMIELARTAGSKAIADEMLGKLLSPATIRTSPQTVRDARAMMESVPAEASIAALTAMRDRPDRTALLPQLKVPLGVIVGEDDAPSPPDVGRKIVEQVADGWIEVVPNAGHLAAIEQPAAVARAIGKFLTM